MPTAIVSALPEEQGNLLARLSLSESITHVGRTFWRGQLYGKPVVLAGHFGVARMVFTGVAGGVGEGVRVGDVVVAHDTMQHDMDASPIFPRWDVPGYGVRLPCDARLSSALEHAARVCLADTSSHVHKGLIASGDQFISTTQASHALRTALSKAGHEVLAVEMEGAAAAQVCRDFSIPFAAMRTISDRADDDAPVDFAHFVQNVASRYTEDIVLRLMQML